MMFKLYDKITNSIIHPLNGDGDSFYLSLEGQVCSFEEGFDEELQYRGYRMTPLLCTGRKDVSGNFIYDGDILAPLKFGTNEISNGMKWKVYYNEEKMAFYWTNGDCNERFYEYDFGSAKYVIVGNVYENKDLLDF